MWKRSYVEDVYEELSIDEPCFKPDAHLHNQPNTKRGLLPPNSDLSDLSSIGGLDLSSRRATLVLITLIIQLIIRKPVSPRKARLINVAVDWAEENARKGAGRKRPPLRSLPT